ncbi:helix-turn-helix domain-containing protein [Novibacillus thermophilus]|uniref:HTH cro/C1-type domain-containing protein n=1 Tax=Novibacillus thermophilus TaxID=1471761 RepID=A0A1U9KAD1_9BACL|nr:helix-turn-helix transcriptional regulator [Novibacillus thermophilus]AQS57025.1 hypothetical protein B0W44_15970 [Novibacillus thermophilus]
MSSVVGNRIKLRRNIKGWSQRELARRVGLNYSVMNRIESGKRPVGDTELRKIAEVLDVSTDYLLGRTDDPIPDKAEKTFEEWINDPETVIFFKDYLKAPEERKEELRRFWEFMKEQENQKRKK